jgi:two-component system, chemotaxis family, chemotaxis protein CheY
MSKILVIDDSSTSRESMECILKGEGHTVIQAENGIMGLEKFRENMDSSLIFVDVNMPQMNGIEFLGHLRKMSKDIPVVILTTELDKEKMDLAKVYKANAWIIKPLQENDLKKVINILLK